MQTLPPAPNILQTIQFDPLIAMKAGRLDLESFQRSPNFWFSSSSQLLHYHIQGFVTMDLGIFLSPLP